MLNQNNFIPRLVKDQFVDKLLRQKNAETARSHSLLDSVLNMGQRIFWRVMKSRVWQLFGAEARAGITKAIDNGALSANRSHFDHFVRIEGRAVFHGIQQNLAECCKQGESIGIW